MHRHRMPPTPRATRPPMISRGHRQGPAAACGRLGRPFRMPPRTAAIGWPGQEAMPHRAAKPGPGALALPATPAPAQQQQQQQQPAPAAAGATGLGQARRCGRAHATGHPAGHAADGAGIDPGRTCALRHPTQPIGVSGADNGRHIKNDKRPNDLGPVSFMALQSMVVFKSWSNSWLGTM